MKVIKILGIIIVILIAIAVGVGIYVSNNLNAIVKDSVETYGPTITGTPVKLNKVDIQLKNAAATLNGFSVGNVAGYKADNLFAFDVVGFDIDPVQLRDKRVVVEALTIGGITVNAEEKALKTNIQAMLDRFTSGAQASEQAEPEAAPSDLRFIIKSLVFKQSDINLTTEKYGDYNLPLPSFELSNIGGTQGIPASELGTAILKPLLRQAEKAAKRRIKEVAKDKVKEKAEEKLKEKLNEKVSQEKQDEIKEKLDGVKGLFGR